MTGEITVIKEVGRTKVCATADGYVRITQRDVMGGEDSVIEIPMEIAQNFIDAISLVMRSPQETDPR